MSILIKGMEMPLICEECPCYDSSDYSCNATGRGVIDYRYNGRPDKCPLVDVFTPHGRLIDADKLIAFITNGLNRKENPMGFDAIEILTEIEYAPIIIEAEVSE